MSSIDCGYKGRVRKSGRLIETGTFDTPEQAYHAMEGKLAREFPREYRVQPVTLPNYLAR